MFRLYVVSFILSLVIIGNLFSREDEPMQIEYDRHDRVMNQVNGLSIGLYTGFQNFAGEIYPQESFTDTIYDMKLMLIGVSLKLKYKFLFLRAAAEGGLTVLGGQGDFESGNVAETYKITTMHFPATLGFNFPLLNRNSIYIGMGYSYFTGDLNIASDTVDTDYSYKGSGVHFIMGTDLFITNSVNLLFEWMHTSGMSESLGDTLKEREVGFKADQFILGVNYLFDF